MIRQPAGYFPRDHLRARRSDPSILDAALACLGALAGRATIGVSIKYLLTCERLPLPSLQFSLGPGKK